MNYYNPYFGNPASFTGPMGGGLLKSIFGKGFSFSSILTNTQRTLGIINQVIPVVKQVSPVFNNAKTMFKVMNEFKKVDPVINKETSQTNSKVNSQTNSKVNSTNDDRKRVILTQGPTFFA
ncbi:MAG: VrrA/YqfQ family protein [Bacilli bacterium]